MKIRRRRRVIRIFPDGEACLRLICALCIEQNEPRINPLELRTSK
ncbi:hypothetical protein DRJ00_03790 [Candidatus Aerophobetes bacterium]|uniref:Uncharacterized protein n=1 Tax=Aerophobetes bacterium TaxID=2030807 RepID=A0A497E4D5_UNCAE|nr:MAG: hypothetical protein DRJ00_03790 [Candidatus Aerophobetes bacterium]